MPGNILQLKFCFYVCYSYVNSRFIWYYKIFHIHYITFYCICIGGHPIAHMAQGGGGLLSSSHITVTRGGGLISSSNIIIFGGIFLLLILML